MGQKIKHGRQAIDRLGDGLKAIDELARQIDDSLLPPNIRLIQRNIEEIRRAVLDLSQFVSRQLDPMLARREQAQSFDELAAQLAALAADLADVRERLAVLERSHVPERHK